MSKFQILDEKRYPLKISDPKEVSLANWTKSTCQKDLLPYWRWEHRVTLGRGAREYMLFIDNMKTSVHIEEISGGHLEVILDDSLFESLLEFAKSKGYCNLLSPMFKETGERFI